MWWREIHRLLEMEKPPNMAKWLSTKLGTRPPYITEGKAFYSMLCQYNKRPLINEIACKVGGITHEGLM